jgi:diguanylate cyclase (GGDEF)-like protein
MSSSGHPAPLCSRPFTRFPPMLKLHRTTLLTCTLLALLILILYASVGAVKPLHAWDWMDIVSEGGTTLLAGCWLIMLLSSRPGGMVTRWLAGGLAAIMLGNWADLMDEFFKMGKAFQWNHWLEAMVGMGMLTLTVGLYYWRHEQANLSQHLEKRERLFRDHRAFDRITQLADADYLRRQIRLERQRRPGQDCAVALLDIDGFHLINRMFGQAEGDRALQAVGHMLLLNLRSDDLLCRYAGDRFALLMPGTSEADATILAHHLCDMVGRMRHHAGGTLVPLTLRHACAAADDAPETVLRALNQAVHQSATAPA